MVRVTPWQIQLWNTIRFLDQVCICKTLPFVKYTFTTNNYSDLSKCVNDSCVRNRNERTTKKWRARFRCASSGLKPQHRSACLNVRLSTTHGGRGGKLQHARRMVPCCIVFGRVYNRAYRSHDARNPLDGVPLGTFIPPKWRQIHGSEWHWFGGDFLTAAKQGRFQPPQSSTGPSDPKESARDRRGDISFPLNG